MIRYSSKLRTTCSLKSQSVVLTPGGCCCTCCCTCCVSITINK
ncbi:streptolysin S family TOMM toxin [Brachyspira hampsonii]